MDFDKWYPALVCTCYDRRREGMLTGAFKACRQADKGPLLLAWEGHYGGEEGLALGERAGLIHHERVHLPEHLERLGVFNQHSSSGPAAGTHHEGHWNYTLSREERHGLLRGTVGGTIH